MKDSLRSLMGVGVPTAFRLAGVCLGIVIGGAATQSSIIPNKSNIPEVLLFALVGLIAAEVVRRWLFQGKATS